MAYRVAWLVWAIYNIKQVYNVQVFLALECICDICGVGLTDVYQTSKVTFGKVSEKKNAEGKNLV